MIRKENLLNSYSPKIKEAANFVDFNIGSMYDLQILISTDLDEKLESFLIQGGKLNEVNDERQSNGLHKITPLKNEKIVSKDWIELIKKNKGIVFLLLSGSSRRKTNAVIESAIDLTKERFEDIQFDANKGVQGDYFFLYEQSDVEAKKVAETVKKPAKKKLKKEVEEVKNEKA